MDKVQEVAFKQKLLGLAQSGQFVEAEKIALYLLEQNSADTEVWFALAQIQAATEKYDSALAAYKRVATKKSGNRRRALSAMIDICVQLRKYEEGADAARKLLKDEPKSAVAHYQLGFFLCRLKKVHEGATHLKRAILYDENNASYHVIYGESLVFLGDISGALAQFDQAGKLDSTNDLAYLKSIMYQNYSDQLRDDEVYNAHLEFGQRLESRYPAITPFPTREHTQKIRVAYLSADFRRHSVSYFFSPIAERYDRNVFDVYCYADFPPQDADEVTTKLRELTDYWVDASAMTDEQLFQKIRGDGIDILVDLAGYTGSKSRMEVFARKAAPIQASYLGYPNTTGLSRVDYRIVDEYTDPVGSADGQSSEELVRLPGGFLCFEPEDDVPDVQVLPAKQAGVFTFGSFNSSLKITDKVLAAWSEILSQTPNSRLYIKAEVLSDKVFKQDFIKRCKRAGINVKNLVLAGRTIDRNSHFTEYHKVDLHLDTFPYNGTTTTFEAMWMGVPTVVLQGGAHRSRVGFSILSHLGMNDFVANNHDEYVAVAVGKAKDIAGLEKFRSESREVLRGSTLMDQSRFINELENFYAHAVKEKLGL